MAGSESEADGGKTACRGTAERVSVGRDKERRTPMPVVAVDCSIFALSNDVLHPGDEATLHWIGVCRPAFEPVNELFVSEHIMHLHR